MNGVIIVRKEKGMTSFGVVAAMRRIFSIKKIGHTGTLDPDAEGVLPVCIGRATKLVESLTRGTKTYRADLLLGVVTDTQDTTGTVLYESPVTVSEEEVRDTILSFFGKQKQLPPMYSAVKVNGQKLVDLARRGIEVERKERDVEFLDIRILSVDLPKVTFEVTCSHGSYIRTLCHDIGQKLGCGGAMDALVRTRVGEFAIEDALTLDEIRERKAAEDAVHRENVPADTDDLVIKSDGINAGPEDLSGQAGGMLAGTGDLSAKAVSESIGNERITRHSAGKRTSYSFLIPIDYFYRNLQEVHLAGAYLPMVLSGNPVAVEETTGQEIPKGTEVRLYAEDGAFIGVYRRGRHRLRLVKYFYED
ncbi:MAG: tRNA pseudouridine(55) synthase TruB [Lachnospiraceae bacterium]|nr:tRNA pseudouridine(55) synthase TruB [Lachnospiraceae bacterium]